MKILVIQLRRIGDVVLTTPVFGALRAAYPDAEIHFLAESPCDQIAEGNPHLDAVLRYDKTRTIAWLRRIRRERYDLVIDFMGNPRSAILTRFSGAKRRAGPGHVFHSWAYNLRFPPPQLKTYLPDLKLDFINKTLSVPRPAETRPRIELSSQHHAQAQAVMNQLGLGKRFLFGVAPFHRRVTRRWPAEYWAQLLALFHRDHEADTLVFWGPGERDWVEALAKPAPDRIRLIPDLRDLKVVTALLSRCAAAAACDNGLKNMAVAVSVPTLTVFGATNPDTWNPPDTERHPWVRREELFCIGCNLNRCPYRLECMTALSPERVYEKLKTLLLPILALNRGGSK